MGRVVAEESGELLPVLGVLVDSELQVLSELLVQFGELLLVLADLVQKLHALLNDVLADDLEDLGLLEGLPGDVKWEIFAVYNTPDEVC